MLEHVEVAIKFIASLGGQPDTKIYNYLHNTLKYQMSIHRFSSAVSVHKEYLADGHIPS